MAGKRALILLAEGAEEMETVISVDVLRRGGIEVLLAGIAGPQAVKCSRGVMIQPDVGIADVKPPYDAIILPGGAQGAKNLCTSAEVGKLLKQHWSEGKIVAAICAGPTALKAHGIGAQKSVTSHPSVKNELEQSYAYKEDRVVQDGNLVTSRAPGTTFEFALKLVELLAGLEKRKEIVPPMLLQNG